MKQSLEKIVTYARSPNGGAQARIANCAIDVAIDYKVILMSNYVSRRVFELSGMELEISFIYGGCVKHASNKTILKLDSFYVPVKQKISQAAFFGTSESTYDANAFFARQQKRIVAIGHSHASFDVFHSATDLDNYKSLVGTIGVKIAHNPDSGVEVSKKYDSFSRRLGAFFSINKMQKNPADFSYILPSLVFNAEGKYVDSKIASKSYAQIGGKLQTHFQMHDCNLRVYNKQSSLTDDEKRMLDYSVRKVLHYNKLLQRKSETGKKYYYV